MRFEKGIQFQYSSLCVNQGAVSVFRRGYLEKGELERGNLNLGLALSKMHTIKNSPVG